MSEPVGRSTGVPNCVWLCVPPARRSSPVIAGPSFLRWTSIAIHEPTRAWPSSRTRASIVGRRCRQRRPGAARRRARRGTRTRNAERGGRRCSGAGTDGARRLRVGVRLVGRSKDVSAPRESCVAGATTRAGLPSGMVASPLPLSYDAFVPQPSARAPPSRRSRARDPTLSAPSASTRPSSATSLPSSRRRTTSSTRSAAPAGRPPPGQRRPARPAGRRGRR